MRLPAIILFGLCVSPLLAQAGDPAANLKDPLPPPPISGPGPEEDEALGEPQITITADATIEEFRMGGKLYMIKITPKKGKPYYLVDDQGDGKFARQESLDSGFRPPRWVIFSF